MVKTYEVIFAIKVSYSLLPVSKNEYIIERREIAAENKSEARNNLRVIQKEIDGRFPRSKLLILSEERGLPVPPFRPF